MQNIFNGQQANPLTLIQTIIIMVCFTTDLIVLSQIFIVDDGSDARWMVGDLLERYVNAAFPRRAWGHVVRVCICVSGTWFAVLLSCL